MFTGLTSLSASAATITWGAATRIVNDDTQVTTVGSLDYAYSFSGSDVSLNGVTFKNSNSASDFAGEGNITTTTLDSTASAFGGTTTLTPFNDLSASYQSLITGAAWIDKGSGNPVVTLNNLTIGKDYTLQIWISDYRNLAENRSATLSSGANSVSLDYNGNPFGAGSNTDSNGGVGQFTIATFTANSLTQTFQMGGDALVPQMNAIQLRSIPEPSATLLLGLGGLGLMARRKRI